MITLVIASGVVFTVLEVFPGDPAELMLGPDATPEMLAALRAKLGLNELTRLRNVSWTEGVLMGNLGESYTIPSRSRTCR
ncbi:hypothetical protein ACYCVF_35780 [Bradyrhizobium sp. 1.29L]